MAKEKSTKDKKYLVIVESPAKAKTIQKVLGKNYEIKASYGHIRDFPKKILGIDVHNQYEPVYEVIPEKKKVVDELNKAAKQADEILLAPDPDREGEAIAWHIKSVLENVKNKKIQRIVFNEITKTAIEEAVKNPRDIDESKVEAQKARQILDRVVGYKISPVLWEKTRNYNLSAGRVQSVAVRLICEREEEIEAFNPEEYWTITATLEKENKKFEAELTKYKGKKAEIKNQSEAEEIVKYVKKSEIIADNIATKNTKRNPQPPFITSTLQRDASSRLGYGVSKTMQVAQKLYEGIELGGEGHVGLITYMRTDSTRISDEAQEAAKDFVLNEYGKEYYPKEARVYVKKGKNVQDAHEAIRPTYIEKTPASIKQYLSNDEYKLYKLIWERFLSSQMESAVIKNDSIEFLAGDYTLRSSSSKVMFDGFLKIYDDRTSEDEYLKALPDFKKGDEAKLDKLDPKQHFTQPPPRYTEASLVKTLEELGIGRPSTYAPIISKIQQRDYVEKRDRSLAPTILGKTINKQLVEHFGTIVNYDFTAGMETTLDEIAEDKAEWRKVVGDFYTPFNDVVQKARENMGRVQLVSDKICPNCGKPMLVRKSRFNTNFLGCSGYPECKTMMPLSGEEKTETPVEEKCEKCGGDMVMKQGPYGQYLSCLNEECKHRKPVIKSTGVKCPQCDGEIIEKKSKRGKIFYGCKNYPKCNFALWNKPIDEKCPECGEILTERFLKKGRKVACSKCKYAREEENNIND